MTIGKNNLINDEKINKAYIVATDKLPQKIIEDGNFFCGFFNNLIKGALSNSEEPKESKILKKNLINQKKTFYAYLAKCLFERETKMYTVRACEVIYTYLGGEIDSRSREYRQLLSYLSTFMETRFFKEKRNSSGVSELSRITRDRKQFYGWEYLQFIKPNE